MSPIEKRCRQRNTNAFVVSVTVDLLAEKMVGIIGDRRMTKMHRYLGEQTGTPRLFPGLRVWHGGYGGAVNHRQGVGASVALASQTRSFEIVGFSIDRDGETEEQVRERYHHPEKQWLGQRRDITFVELDGWPGEPGREDSIRVEYWNQHGVGQETLIVFDDLNLVQEIAWDVKGDRERQMWMLDEFCHTHGMHFEHPDHQASGCKGRQSTRAEDLAVLAVLAQAKEGGPA
jgi:hypothetical protein